MSTDKKMSHKRSSSDSVGSMERTPKKVPRACDPYCWLCHQKGTDQLCSTCNLSYHLQCIGIINGPKINNYKCDLCDRMRKAQEDYVKRQVNMDEFHRMLEGVVKRIFENKSFARLKTFEDREPVNGGPSLINPYNLEIVSEKVDDNQYKSTVEFLKDIRQIRHNAEVVSTDGMKRLAIARELETWCAKEMYDIEICSQCFSRTMDSNDWFTDICDPPHLLVWAKLAGYPYWPAKLIGILSTANRLDVRFFGDHDMANVSAQDCFLYPSKNPNRRLDEKTEQQIEASEKEAKQYIQKIETKYNCVVPVFQSRIQLVVKCIDQLLTTMIPNLNLPSNFKLKRKPSYLQKMQCHKSRKLTSPQPPPSGPPLSSLTPPPSPPLPSPLSSVPSFLPSTIKYSISDDDLLKMNQFTLKIHRCDGMPEFIVASKSNRPDGLCANGGESSIAVDLITDDGQNNLDGNEIEFVEVDVVMAGDFCPDASFNTLVYSTASESSHSKESLVNLDCDTNENQPNDKSNIIISNVANNPERIHGIEQPNIADDIEVPSPPMEPVGPAIALEMNVEKLPEIQRLNGIINQVRTTNAQHIEDKIKMQTEIVQLKESLAKSQHQHSIALQKAIEDTKNKQWCVNCKKEASITKYKLPVCSTNCLLLVWEENMKRGKRALSELGN